MPSTRRRNAGVAALALIPGIIWGASFLFIAEGLEILPPMGVTFVRVALGFATLALFPAARQPVPRSDWPAIALLGLSWFAFPLAMFPLAERHVSSALAGLLNGATPLFAVAFAAVIAGRLPTRAVWLALAAGGAGLALIAAPTFGQGENEAFSVGLILAALTSYGLAINLAAPLQRRLGALAVTWRALGVALVLTLPWGGPALGEMRWSWTPVLCLATLGIFGTAIANVMTATLAGRFGAGAASSVTFVIPVVAAVLGITLRNEPVSPFSLAGGGVCLLAAWLLLRAPAAPSAPARATGPALLTPTPKMP